MTDDNKMLANLLFPAIEKTPEYYEKKYPPRSLKEGARVTRFAPSPTGFLHFGNLFSCSIAYYIAKKSDGVFFVRIEDTDQKRKVDGAVEIMLSALKQYGIVPDEGAMSDGNESGDYGPYTQSHRKDIYQTYAKKLVEDGLAYPCFCTPEDLEALHTSQESEDVKGYWGKYAKCRDLTFDQIKTNIESGLPWTLRLKSPGSTDNRIIFDDLIKGKIEMPENVVDVVLLKADGIPTYHFAHAVDDHLMRTTHVVRGDEWISSVPLHIQLFKLLGFKPMKYVHIATIMKEDNGGKRKLSKRKDPEAAVTYYTEVGFPSQSLNEYIMTLANSNFEDWRRANQAAPLSDFPFNVKKMSISGALLDLVKLTDVSKNVICKMTADTVYDLSYKWATEYNKELAHLYDKNPTYAKGILNIDRENKKPRKDIAKWSDIPDYISYMYDETFAPCYDLTGNAAPKLAFDVLTEYIDVFDVDDDKDTWFNKMKDLCPKVGCTPNVKEFKQNPDDYKGHVGDVSTIIRVALTGRTNTPDLYAIMSLLGKDAVRSRLVAAANHYKEEQ